MSSALHTVHIRVNDAGTGKPTPCRLRCTGPDGTYYAPFGRLTQLPTGFPTWDTGGNVEIAGKLYAYIDGTSEIRLPAGNVHIEISKGPEYTPIDCDVSLGIGQMALRFTLER